VEVRAANPSKEAYYPAKKAPRKKICSYSKFLERKLLMVACVDQNWPAYMPFYAGHIGLRNLKSFREHCS